jgi:anaerobic magnesium-protoporphyrin IX monomethyl ester cyclase
MRPKPAVPRLSVLLCNPPGSDEGTPDRESATGMGAWLARGAGTRPPHTLAWSAAALRQSGWDVSALDAAVLRLSPGATTGRIASAAPSLLVILTSPTTAAADAEFVHLLRAELPALPLLLVGRATRYLPTALAASGATILVGDPEGSLDAACRDLLSSNEPATMLTPQMLGVDGYDSRGHLLDLEHLPLPAWDLFPVRRYPYIPIVASRGCDRGCRYCPAPVTEGSTHRARRVQRVAAEIQLLNRRHGVRRFRFVDPLFAYDRDHTLALCRALVERGLPRRLSWSCETRPEQLDLVLLHRMSRAGCGEIHLGLESVSPDTLLAMGRVADEQAAQLYLKRVRQVLLGCRAFGIACHLHVLAGLPGDSAGAAATRAFLRAYPPHTVHIAALNPYPGISVFPTNQYEAEQALLETVTEPATLPRSRWPLLSRAMRLRSA